MARIIAIDFGIKRTGIAVTDPLQIIATGLTTIVSKDLIPFLKDYFLKEQVELILIGLPMNLDNTPTHGTLIAKEATQLIINAFPHIPVKELDERFTSKMARQAMIEMELKKNKRRDKKIVDEIAATILLQGYMDSI